MLAESAGLKGCKGVPYQEKRCPRKINYWRENRQRADGARCRCFGGAQILLDRD